MTRTAPGLEPPSPNFRTTPGGRLTTTYDLASNRPIHGGSSMESGLEPGTSGPKAEALPLGHRGRSASEFEDMKKILIEHCYKM
ncbi:hypothetical protein AVEN_27981-1 [Araneus ventricosus]|nr:hypothetical protein AVEN_27981-1 [Araneus ventricosus]